MEINPLQRLVQIAEKILQREITRCSQYMTLAAGTNVSPSFTDSIGMPPWARFIQVSVSSTTLVQVAFAKDTGTINVTNPANWEAEFLSGPATSAFIALPVSGQVRLLNYGGGGYATVVLLSSLGAS